MSQSTTLEAIAGNPATRACGVIAAAATHVQVSADTTIWDAGIWLSNGHATDTVYAGPTGVTAAAGTNRILIGPGQCLPYTLSKNLSEIYIISSGTPLVTYMASGS